MDLNALSDDDLLRFIGGEPVASPAPKAPGDLDNLSDEELLKFIGASPKEAPSQWENFKRGISALIEDPSRAVQVGPARMVNEGVVQPAIKGAQTAGGVWRGEIDPQSPEAVDAMAGVAMAAPLAGRTGVTAESVQAAGGTIRRPNVPSQAAVAPAVPPVTAPNVVAAAAERQGIDVPRAVTSESPAIQQIGQIASKAPLIGDPIGQAVERTVQQMGEAVASKGGPSMEQSGAVASRGIRDWITGSSKELVENAYNRVDEVVKPDVRIPLNATVKTVSEISARRANAKLATDSKAVNQVLDAATAPDGMNYFGVKDLRTSIGEQMSSGILPEGMSKAEMKQIYGALSDDLRSSAAAAGGPRGLQLFERANTLNAKVAERREKLAEIVGLKGDRTPAEVFSRIKAAATGTSRADTALLAQARRVMGNDWEEVVSGMVGQMGQNKKGEFSLPIFLNDYSKLTDKGKSILFTPALKQSLDDIATIGGRLNEVSGKFGNPSGTGRTTAGFGLAIGALADPITTFAAAVGGNIAARALARPATAQSVARWAKAVELAAERPSPATASNLQRATDEFAKALNSQLGVRVSAPDLMRALNDNATEPLALTVGGPRRAGASDRETEEQERR